MFYPKITFLALLLFSISNWFCYAAEIKFQKVDPNEVLMELTILSSVVRSNYEKIKSWQGNIVFQDVIVYRGKAAAYHVKQHVGVAQTQDTNEINAIYDGTIEFRIDFENNRFFSHINRPQPVSYVDIGKGQDYMSSSGAFEKIKIRTPEYQIESYPDRWTKDGAVSRRIARKQPPGKQDVNLGGTDPRMCFNVGRPVWDVLSQLSQTLQNQREGIPTFGTVLEKGKAENEEIYRVQVTKPGVDKPILVMTLKSSSGFNPAYIETRSDETGLLLSQITTDFVEVKGIFLPQKREEKQYDKSGAIQRDSNWTFQDMQVNMTISSDAFGYKGCKLKDNDRIIDEKENKKYRYKGSGNLVEVADED